MKQTAPEVHPTGIEADFRRGNANREQWTSRQWRVAQRVDRYREYTDKKPERVQTHHLQKMRFLGMKRYAGKKNRGTEGQSKGSPTTQNPGASPEAMLILTLPPCRSSMNSPPGEPNNLV